MDSVLARFTAIGALSEVSDLDTAPTIVQILRHQTAVAVVGLIFAAPQAAVHEGFLRDRLLEKNRSFIGFTVK